MTDVCRVTPVLQVAETLEALRSFRQSVAGQTIAFVPTMGALHEGHCSLIRKARELADRVVVSIYVNPLQFGPEEDLSRYPRSLEADLAACEALGADLAFTPTDAVIYPEGRDAITHVVPPAELTEQLCGLSRPGHFEGVATVVLKLFHMVEPDIAVFGEKDAQQLAVIRRMVRDLNLPMSIVGHPTVREADGLALSSRNKYFQTAEQRQAALILSQTLFEAQARFALADRPLVRPLLDECLAAVLARPEFRHPAVQALFRLGYLEARQSETFLPVETLTVGTRILMAAYVGNVRLIDNILLPGD